MGKLIVVAIGDPAEAVGNFTKPGRFIFPLYLANVLDCIESEIYATREFAENLLSMALGI